MTRPNHCSSSEMQAVPTRLPMRVYMRVGKIPHDEALNCGIDSGAKVGAEIGETLKSVMNRWKADGLNTDTGKVDYQRLAESKQIDDYRPLAAALREFDPALLSADAERKAFWINIYNAMLIHGVVAYRARTSLWNIRAAFERIAYIIGGFRYSLDDIEHGILRGNKAHFVIGGKRFSAHDPRGKHVLGAFDPRIHFALVCGASSCPPIGIYQAERLDTQLDLAARSFIDGGGVLLNKDDMTVSLSRVFQWYSPDFGGKWMGIGSRSPVVKYVASYLADEEDRKFLLKNAIDLRVGYQHYDWALNV